MGAGRAGGRKRPSALSKQQERQRQGPLHGHGQSCAPRPRPASCRRRSPEPWSGSGERREGRRKWEGPSSAPVLGSFAGRFGASAKPTNSRTNWAQRAASLWAARLRAAAGFRAPPYGARPAGPKFMCQPRALYH